MQANFSFHVSRSFVLQCSLFLLSFHSLFSCPLLGAAFQFPPHWNPVILIHILDTGCLPQTSFSHQPAKISSPCLLPGGHWATLLEFGHRVTEVTEEKQGTSLWLYSGSKQGQEKGFAWPFCRLTSARGIMRLKGQMREDGGCSGYSALCSLPLA